MAAIDFPDTPTIGQQFTVDERTWEWNGTTWDSVRSGDGGGGGGAGFTWVNVSSDTGASTNNVYSCDTSEGAITITLPSPVFGNVISFVDAKETFHTYPVTITGNGTPIEGSDVDLVLNVSDAFVTLAYYNTTEGWKVI